MKKKRVTAEDVAREAGVSRSTVSMILNNYQNISFSEETKMRVLDACSRLGYRTIGSGRLESIDGRLLLVVCPSFQNGHYIKVSSAIQERARELGYTALILCTKRSADEENRIIRLCRELHVAGVILTYQPEKSFVVQLTGMETHVVKLYDKSGNTDVDALELDNYKFGRLVAEHLLSLGHTCIAHISDSLSGKQSARSRRVEGIRSYLAEQGLNPDDHLRISTIETEHLEITKKLEGYETGYLLASHLIDHNVPVTAFAAMNDTVAYGVIDAIVERGKRVPQDYSVCGCDNLPSSAYQKISLTTVEPYITEKARDAVDLLARKIRAKGNGGRKKGPVSITRIEYEPQLIVRKSTGRCMDKNRD